MVSPSELHITVCIATRGRGNRILATLAYLARSSHKRFDVVVVDQSNGDATQLAILGATDLRLDLTYVQSRTRGAAAARNVAARRAQGEIVAFIDDDCEPECEWLSSIADHFSDDPTIAQINGEVRAAPHPNATGFVPAYYIRSSRRIQSPWLKWRDRGLSANMAVRASALASVGYFDEALGPGGPLKMGEDFDLTYRILKAGFAVLLAPDVAVFHRGFRMWSEARRLLRDASFGIGAAYGKHLRLGDIAIMPTVVLETFRCISWRRLIRLQRYSGIGRLISFFNGMLAGLRFKVDRAKATYLPISDCDERESLVVTIGPRTTAGQA